MKPFKDAIVDSITIAPALFVVYSDALDITRAVLILMAALSLCCNRNISFLPYMLAHLYAATLWTILSSNPAKSGADQLCDVFCNAMLAETHALSPSQSMHNCFGDFISCRTALFQQMQCDHTTQMHLIRSIGVLACFVHVKYFRYPLSV